MASIVCANCGHKTILPTARTTCPACGQAFASSTGSTSFGGSPSGSTSPGGYGGYSGTTSGGYSPVPYGSSSMSPLSYPPGLPTHLPDLEGTVDFIQRDTIYPGLDWSDWVLRIIFFPLMLRYLLVAIFSMRAASPRMVTIHRLDVKTAMGVRQARIEGDLVGGAPTLGQEVALWGNDERGTLLVKQGYNKSNTATINSRQDNHIIKRGCAIVLLCLVLIVALSVCSLLSPH